MIQLLRSSLLRCFSSRSKFLLTAVFCFVFLLPLSSIAQHQPVPSDPGIELTPSDKFHHVLQQIAAHNDSDKLPDTWQAAFEKLNSDFPIHKALGRSYHKESIDVWLQRSSSSFHEHYAFFCDYLNQLDSQK